MMEEYGTNKLRVPLFQFLKEQTMQSAENRAEKLRGKKDGECRIRPVLDSFGGSRVHVLQAHLRDISTGLRLVTFMIVQKPI